MGANMVRRLKKGHPLLGISRGEADSQDKFSSAMRFPFGGHHELSGKP